MIEVFEVLAEESGIPLDGHAFVTRLGPPLAQELSRYHLDEPTIAHLVARYRELTPSLVIPRTVALPGAIEAVAAVTRRGGRAVVVTAKHGGNATAHLEALGIEVSAVVGDLWSTAKASALQAMGAEVFVGDHLGDIAGAEGGRRSGGRGRHRPDQCRGSGGGRRRRRAGRPDAVPAVARVLPCRHRPLTPRSTDATVH